MTTAHKPEHVTLHKFISPEFLKENAHFSKLGSIDQLLSKFNGGTFMECHHAIYESTGIWIEELVPVFQRLDVALASRDLTVHK